MALPAGSSRRRPSQRRHSLAPADRSSSLAARKREPRRRAAAPAAASPSSANKRPQTHLGAPRRNLGPPVARSTWAPQFQTSQLVAKLLVPLPSSPPLELLALNLQPLACLAFAGLSSAAGRSLQLSRSTSRLHHRLLAATLCFSLELVSILYASS